MTAERGRPVAWRNIGLLRGVAIVLVVLNHATVRSFGLALSAGESVTPASSPVAFGVLAILRSLSPVCVPAFFFASGFFLVRFRSGPGVQLRAARGVLRKYLQWAVPLFAVTVALAGEVDPGAIARGLLLGGPFSTYWFLVVLAGLYVLAPLLTWLVERRPRLAVFAAATAEIVDWAVFYAEVDLEAWPLAAFFAYRHVMHVPFFLAGMLASRHVGALVGVLSARGRRMAWLVTVCAALAVAESLLLGHAEGWAPHAHGRMFSGERVSLTLLVVCTIGWSLTLSPASGPWGRRIMVVGLSSLGVFFMVDGFQHLLYAVVWHLPEWTGMSQAPPWLPLQWVLLPAFVAVGLWGPLGVIRITEHLIGNRARVLW